MQQAATRFLKDESGASAVEYALIAAGMVVIVLAMIGTLSDALTELAESLAGKMTIE